MKPGDLLRARSPDRLWAYGQTNRGEMLSARPGVYLGMCMFIQQRYVFVLIGGILWRFDRRYLCEESTA